MPIEPTELSLETINIQGGTQARVRTTDEAIESYAEEMNQGTVFPPIIVYFDGATHWLADGFHRYLAAKRIGRTSILAEINAGGRSDALRHALGANATNGVYRTNDDKRNAVEIALEEWPDLANPVIAEICRVSVELVRRRVSGVRISDCGLRSCERERAVNVAASGERVARFAASGQMTDSEPVGAVRSSRPQIRRPAHSLTLAALRPAPGRPRARRHPEFCIRRASGDHPAPRD